MGNSYSDVQFKVFDWLRFPLIVGVVFIHCFGKTLDFDAIDFANLSGMDCFNLFRVSISRVLTHICVPVFFLMSGYLFFIGLEKWNNKIFLNKIKKRCKSLLIPYLIWNSVSIFLSLIGIYRHDGFGGVQNFFLVNEYWHLYWDCNVWNMDRLNWIGGGAGASGPYLVPLWFLRNLMVVVLCSPLLYFFFKRLKICGIIILLLCYVSGIFINKPGFSAMAFLFFGAGAYFRMNSINVAQITYKYRLLIYVSAVILWILCTMYNGHNTCIGNIVYPFYVIVGSLALLNISTCIVKKDVLKIPLLLTKSSFFIYLSHCILVVKYALVISEKIFGNTNPILLTVGYLFTPTITVAICVFIFFIINRFMPHLCKVLTGYR